VKKPHAIHIGNASLGGQELLLILGPCVMESASFTRRMAKRIHEVSEGEGVPFVFKASYDKANRSSIKSFRGPGASEGCKILGEISAELGVPVTSDIHSVEEVELAAKFLDLLQIPAFLCRQTDLIVAAGASGRPVNVKKGQFLAPWDMKQVAVKLAESGCRDFFFTERGSTFGYNNLVADMRSIPWMQDLGVHVVFDATHSVQRPGGAGETTGGDGALAPVLARSAVAAGANGIFMEVHQNPSRALSDGPNQVPLRQLPKILKQLRAIYEQVH